MNPGDYVIWNGTVDRLIGKLRNVSPFGHADVVLLHGGICTVATSQLSPCPMDYVDWAVRLGGTTIPLSDNVAT